MRFFATLALFLTCSLAHAEEAALHVVTPGKEEVLHPTSNWIESDKVVLQGLDKISARVFTTEVFVNQKIHFGSLEIYVRSASRSPPEDKPESVAFLEIFDNKSGQQRQKVFSGWMFSSNPALSALEHPVYDIWVKEVSFIPPAAEAPLPTPNPVAAEDKKETKEEEQDNSDDSDDDVDEDVVVSDDSDEPDDSVVVVDADDTDDGIED